MHAAAVVVVLLIGRAKPSNQIRGNWLLRPEGAVLDHPIEHGLVQGVRC